uniref:Thioredoxin domain-containing protein n=1 Tax=Araucaria cunninghamii TaxID=56994 RepID=A0A0D6QUW4_ARACU
MDTSNLANLSGSKKGLEGTGLSLPVNFHGNLKSAHDDNELNDLLKNLRATKTPAVITYGASWCHICRDVLPTFCNLSNQYAKSTFIYADVDECPEVTKDIRYTPTFQFFRDGERVDEFYGAGQQRLHDRAWLHF